MDPFKVHMQIQQSIQKVVSYTLKYFLRCREDLWECIIEECQKGSINHHINILYFLDSLYEASLLTKAHQPPSMESLLQAKQANTAFYINYVARDLPQIIECVVLILKNWHMKIDEVMHTLSITGDPHLSYDEEWNKCLCEWHWVQAQSQSTLLSAASHMPYVLASFLPLSDTENTELALDIEFENEWEVTSDWNEDDVKAMLEEWELCYPHLRKRVDGSEEELEEGKGGEEPMDLS
ncbi:CTD kinase subunit gamma CTK3-domain-containing protein [Melanogaster broomeanus]|nr:CTD kinase subunit gamma CTK3-domain-containing protein [Melanogaster broomeanus]